MYMCCVLCVCVCTAHIFPLKGGMMGDFYFVFWTYLNFSKLVALTFFDFALRKNVV